MARPTWPTDQPATIRKAPHPEAQSHRAQHGDPERYERYFPRYLLKCLQDWFAHHGDELYEELKHVRNQLYSIEALLSCKHTTEEPEDIVTPMAKAHAVLISQCRHKALKDTRQLKLF